MNPEEDLISALPDNLIVSILFNLPLQSAVTTSVLWRRWKNLWTLIPDLCFDGRARIAPILSIQHTPYNLLEDAIRQINSGFMNWVNQATANSIHTFCLSYLLFTYSDEDSRQIGQWLDFANEKGVKRLELDFSDPFGAKFISKIWGLFIPSSTLQSFTLLTSLSLSKVSLNEKVIDHFLHKCSRLQELRSHYVVGLTRIRIAGPFPSLREIDICECHGDPSFVISRTTLNSLRYVGDWIV